MRISIIFLFCIIVASCHNGDAPLDTTASDTLQTTRGVDSNTANSISNEAATINPNKDSVSKNNAVEDMLQGKHLLTIQWLSFEKEPAGSVSIEKADSGWYSIKGKQENKKGFLKIDGKIKRVTKLELLFDGDITYSIDYIHGNDTCRKSGPQTFLSTKKRKYWRLQNMEGCAGTTDYIDIYF